MGKGVASRQPPSLGRAGAGEAGLGGEQRRLPPGREGEQGHQLGGGVRGGQPRAPHPPGHRGGVQDALHLEAVMAPPRGRDPVGDDAGCHEGHHILLQTGVVELR
eukprot:12318891-Alexandrium_andersonii.AAC.1